MKTKNTPVIFRKFNDGEVIALFPSVPAGQNQNECMSYVHNGQHGAASLAIIFDTKPARPAEYKPLFNELVNMVGYDDLKIYRRYQQWMGEDRASEIALVKRINAGGTTQ